jgi:hypothetical protein
MIFFPKTIDLLPAHTQIVGDRAYISKILQMNLFEQYKVKLKVPFRIISMITGSIQKDTDQNGKLLKLSFHNYTTR